MAKRKAAKKSPARTAKKKATPKKKAAAKGKTNEDFASHVDDMDDAWGDSKKSEPSKGGRGGPNEDVVDGNYVAQLDSVSTGIPRKEDKDGNRVPYMRCRYIIAGGELVGEQLTSFDQVSKVEAFDGKTRLDLLSERLQLMGIETTKMKSLKSLPDICQRLSEEQPLLRIFVKNDHRTNEGGETRHFQNVYINELVPEDEVDDVLAAFDE